MTISIFDPNVWGGLVTLSLLEIVLGIDNVVFLAVLVSRLPEGQKAPARRFGLLMAFALRIVMLIGLLWVIGLTQPVLNLAGFVFS